MDSGNIKTSATMAAIMGVFLPLAETIRRINQILDFKEFFSWFDDYILGALLLGAAYLVFKRKQNVAAYLIAAWGIGVGALFLSFLGQLNSYGTSQGEPGIFPSTFVAVVKGMILAYMLIGLSKAIKANIYQHTGH